MLNILVVDDSLVIRKKIKTFIVELGHNVINEAKDGLQAVELCKELKPDLITMDITMPELDGIESLKLIREFNKDVKVIMVTSHGQEDMVSQSLKVGACGYILKPISKAKLEEAIGNIYEKYQVKNDVNDALDD